MPVIALIAASALAAAEFQPAPVTQDDYPQTALLRQKSAATVLELLTDPAGKVVRCTQSGSVGDKQLAKDMCKIASRKKATPARDAMGHSTFGYMRAFATLALPGTFQGDQIGNVGPAPDIDFQVSSIPAGSTSPVIVNVTIGVGKTGKVTGCNYGSDISNPAFAAAACKQIDGLSFDKLTDAKGTPISYVRPMTVRFSLTGEK